MIKNDTSIEDILRLFDSGILPLTEASKVIFESKEEAERILKDLKDVAKDYTINATIPDNLSKTPLFDYYSNATSTITSVSNPISGNIVLGKGDVVISIDTGKITFDPNYDCDVATKEFWDKLGQECLNRFKIEKKNKELQSKVNKLEKELKATQEVIMSLQEENAELHADKADLIQANKDTLQDLILISEQLDQFRDWQNK